MTLPNPTTRPRQISRSSLNLAKLNAENDDQRVGIEIVRKAVQMPLHQIAENAGEDGAVISDKILDRADYNWGFWGLDDQASEFKDLVRVGIIDPTEVVRSALQHAASAIHQESLPAGLHEGGRPGAIRAPSCAPRRPSSPPPTAISNRTVRWREDCGSAPRRRPNIWVGSGPA